MNEEVSPKRESHLLTQKDIQERRVRRTGDVVKKTGKVVITKTGKVVYGLGKALVDGLQYLGDQGRKSRPQKAVPDMSINLGFGKRTQRKPKGEVDKIFRRKSSLSPRQRRKIRMVRAEKMRRNRF